MAYPGAANLNNQLKIRTLEEASSTSTSAPTCGVVVPFRAKYLYSLGSNLNLVSQTSAGAINLSVNGSTTTADSFVTNPFISVTTSTGNGGSFSSLNNNIATLYLNQGDTLSVTGSSMVPFAMVHILQEF